MKLKYIILISALLLNYLVAQTQRGQLIDPSEKLQIISVVSATTEFLESWTKMPSDSAPHISNIDEVIPNHTYHVAFIVSGYSSKNGRYDFVVHWKLYKPDGSIMFEQMNYAKSSGTTPQKPCFTMADPALDIIFDSTDSFGMYRLVAFVEDNNSKKTVESEKKITLKKIEQTNKEGKGKPVSLPATTGTELDSLWRSYYTTQQPQPIIRIYKTLAFYLERDNINLFAVGAAAKQSFIQYGKKDKMLSEVLKAFQKTSPEFFRPEVDDILQKINQEDGLEIFTRETKDIIAKIADKNKK